MGVFRLFNGCFNGTSRLFQERFDAILEYVTGVPAVFVGCYCPIEFAWLAVPNSKAFFQKHPKRPLMPLLAMTFFLVIS